MPRPKRSLLATIEQTSSPPAALPEAHRLARIIQAAGNNLYSAEFASGEVTLVQMPARFRSMIWVKRGSYVVINEMALPNRDNKIGGEIVNIVRDEKLWRKEAYWPAQFEKRATINADSEDDESTVGRMPPNSDDET
ncbi:MAG: hypothetical protein M1828_003426 [Chrysothrix sp. TS-e1954]|nr:MAG: hypothetical protein M1828_003426 [Chrysothrix sp. TS-e1954]